MARIHTEQLVSAKLQDLHRSLSLQSKDNADPLLAENINLPASEFGVESAHGQETLHRIICEH
jgi:hypothetical protein